MLSDGWDIGIVAERRARDARIAKANPGHAKRILGHPLPKPPVITAPIVLAAPPKVSGKRLETKYPWRQLEIGEHFDVATEETSRKSMAQQARNAFGRHRRRFGVALAVNADGVGVIRVTRVS